MNAEQRHKAADPWTKPADLSHWPACRQLRNYIHNRHHYLLSPKAEIEAEKLDGCWLVFRLQPPATISRSPTAAITCYPCKIKMHRKYNV